MSQHMALTTNYLNVGGLSGDKWRIMSSEVQTVDIYALAETWQMFGEFSHPNYLTHTTPTPHRTVGHQNGGIVCFVSNRIRQLIHSLVVTEYSIRFNLLSHVILIVYLPPSMTHQRVLRELSPPQTRVSLIIGDINTRFGNTYGNTSSGPQQRIDVVHLVSQLHKISLLRPEPLADPGPDHILSTSCLKAKYSVKSPPVRSDHHLVLESNWELPIYGQQSEEDQWQQQHSIRRFNIRLLRDPLIAAEFRTYASTSLLYLWTHLDKLSRNSNTLDSTTLKSLVDDYDFIIMRTIGAAAEHVLGSYDSNQIKKSYESRRTLADTVINPEPPTVKQTISALETIRLWKAAQRWDGATIFNKDPNMSAIEETEQFYSTLFSQQHPDLQCNNELKPPLQGDPLLVAYFDDESVYLRIKKYSKAKSSGSDSIHVILLAALCSSEEDEWTKLMAYYFRFLARIGYTPKRWNRCLISPIPKTENSKYIEEFRPIGLTEMFRRWFEMGVLAFLQGDNSTGTVRTFHPVQAGFLQKHSTMAPALLVHEKSVNNGNKIHTALLDLQCAYDSASARVLIHKLSLRGASAGLQSIIASLFWDGVVMVAVNGQLTKEITRGRGFIQGSILSAFMFNVYIDDLLQKVMALEPSLIFPTSNAFADDLCFQHIRPNTLQHMLNIARDWASDNGMRFNIKKCGTFTPPEEAEFYIGGEVIPYMGDKSYRYLGFPLYRNGIHWQEHIDTGVAKARANLFRTQQISMGWSEYSKMVIYKLIIRPITEYGAGIMYHYNMRRDISTGQISLGQLDTLEEDALRWIFSVGRYTSILRSVADIPLAADRFFSLSIGLRIHLDFYPPTSPIKQTRTGMQNRLLAWYPNSVLLNCFHQERYGTARFQLPRLEPLKDETADQLLNRSIKHYQVREHNSKGTMAQYILYKCRRGGKRNAGYDKTMRWPMEGTRRMAILWRINYLFNKRNVCPTCDGIINRRHIIECGLVPPELLVPGSTLRTQHLHTYPDMAATYTPIDALINEESWGTCHEIFSNIEHLLFSINNATPDELIAFTQLHGTAHRQGGRHSLRTTIGSTPALTSLLLV